MLPDLGYVVSAFCILFGDLSLASDLLHFEY